MVWHPVKQILYLCSVHNRSLRSLCEKMKYLHSVVFPYGLCQPGNYTVAANSTALLSSWSKWWLEFVFYDYTLYAAPGGHIDWRRKRDLIDFRSLTSCRCQNSAAHFRFRRHIFPQSSRLMASILSENPFWDFKFNHIDLIYVIYHLFFNIALLHNSIYDVVMPVLNRLRFFFLHVSAAQHLHYHSISTWVCSFQLH